MDRLATLRLWLSRGELEQQTCHSRPEHSQELAAMALLQIQITCVMPSHLQCDRQTPQVVHDRTGAVREGIQLQVTTQEAAQAILKSSCLRCVQPQDSRPKTCGKTQPRLAHAPNLRVSLPTSRIRTSSMLPVLQARQRPTSFESILLIGRFPLS